MRTICFYVSDYGAGHAARSIALVRAILAADPSVRIIVKSEGPFDLLARSLPDPRVTVIPCRNDISVPLQLGTDAVDTEATRALLEDWHTTWEAFVAREVRFCRDECVSLILSDIVPQPFLVADDAGIPSVAVSNFSWDTIYAHLLSENAPVVTGMRHAYSRASLACILPFHLPMPAFPRRVPVSLLARAITVPRVEMRTRLGIPADARVVFFNPRCPPDQLSQTFLFEVSREPGIRLVMPSPFAAVHPNIIPLPTGETESQNWIGMCDVVVTRCGYSTVSEAVQAQVPLVVWERPGFIEDRAIAATIRRLGVGTAISYPEICSPAWISRLPEFLAYKQHYEQTGRDYTNTGSEEILSHITEFIA